MADATPAARKTWRLAHRAWGIAFAAILYATTAAADAPLPQPEGPVLLRIAGEIGRTNVGNEAHFDRHMINALPPRRLRTRTSVTEGVHVFEGVLVRDLLKAVDASGDLIVATALNDYVARIPIADIKTYDVLAATKMDGKRLERRDKGPLWIVYPRDDFEALQDIRYDYRWVWQLTDLEVR